MSILTLVINGARRELEYTQGERLLQVIQRSGAALCAPCGGNGKCGKCKVDIIRNGSRESVLACRTAAQEGLIAEINDAQAAICAQFSLAGGCYAPDGCGYGAAVDIGTTTVAVELIELSSGSVQAAASEMNAQCVYGADVISRTQYTMDNEDGLTLLSDCILRQLKRMIKALCAERGIDDKTVKVFAAGNTIMQHIAAKLPPRTIAVAPYTPITLFADGAEHGGLCLAPCVSGYIGGDICAGMLVVGLHNSEKKQLFIDLGTNGEMALGGRSGIVCCSVASGPAFEGAGISCGMASMTGAINHISYTGHGFEYSVIGGGEAKGLCGSAIIELTACLMRLGIIDGSGYLQSPEELDDDFGGILGEDRDGNGIVYITKDRQVFFTARDVRQIQLAKAAVAAGIEILMEEARVDEDGIDGLYLAGGFGTYIDVTCACEIGMLPESLKGRTHSVGNSALAGAALALCASEARRELFEIPRLCRYIELSGDRRFNDCFADHMAFYEDD